MPVGYSRRDVGRLLEKETLDSENFGDCEWPGLPLLVVFLFLPPGLYPGTYLEDRTQN